MMTQESEPPDDSGRAEVMLDASAVIALVFAEDGAEAVADAIADGAVISAVNLAEVYTWMSRKGVDPAIGARVIAQMRVEPFTEADAAKVGELAAEGDRLRLSFADRAGIALAFRLGVAAMTGDKAWAKVRGVKVILVRP